MNDASESGKSLVLIQGRPEVHQGLIVDWYLSKLCNYSCTYCGVNIHDQWGPQISETEGKQVLDKIFEVAEKRNLNVNLVGGEPTVQKSLLPLLKYLDEKKQGASGAVKTSIVSNFSRPLENLVELVPYADHFVASIHFEFVHTKLDQLADKLLRFQCEIEKINETLPESDSAKGIDSGITIIRI